MKRAFSILVKLMVKVIVKPCGGRDEHRHHAVLRLVLLLYLPVSTPHLQV